MDIDKSIQEQVDVLAQLIESSPEETMELLEILVLFGYVEVRKINNVPLIVLTEETKRLLVESLNAGSNDDNQDPDDDPGDEPSVLEQ